jgi:hypothetical protein
MQKSTGKVIASIFRDQDGILFTYYLLKGQTSNADCYSSLLVQMKDILKEKSRGKVAKGAFLLHNNAPAHRPLTTQKPTRVSNVLITLPLALSDHHLFS